LVRGYLNDYQKIFVNVKKEEEEDREYEERKGKEEKEGEEREGRKVEEVGRGEEEEEVDELGNRVLSVVDTVKWHVRDAEFIEKEIEEAKLKGLRMSLLSLLSLLSLISLISLLSLLPSPSSLLSLLPSSPFSLLSFLSLSLLPSSPSSPLPPSLLPPLSYPSSCHSAYPPCPLLRQHVCPTVQRQAGH
jgi:hypothetical protein